MTQKPNKLIIRSGFFWRFFFSNRKYVTGPLILRTIYQWSMFSIHRPSKRNENFQFEMYASKHTEIPNNGLSITTETNFLCVQAQQLLLKSNTEPILNNRLKFSCNDPPFLFFSFSYSFPLKFWRRTFFFEAFFSFFIVVFRVLLSAKKNCQWKVSTKLFLCSFELMIGIFGGKTI